MFKNLNYLSQRSECYLNDYFSAKNRQIYRLLNAIPIGKVEIRGEFCVNINI